MFNKIKISILSLVMSALAFGVSFPMKNGCKNFLGHTDEVTSVDISPDGTKIASGSLDKTVRLWNVKTGKCERILKLGVYGKVISVCFTI